MGLLDRLEKRFGRYAIANPTLILVFGIGLVYVADMAQGGRGRLFSQVALVPDLVMQGEVWRLLTFVFTPPPMQPIVFLIYLAAFYHFGNAVEQVWGTFRYNAYLLIGFVATAAAAFLAPQFPASTHFVKTSVFLAYAALLPNNTINLYFVLPVKAKWLAWLTWGLYGYWFWTGSLAERVTIFAAVANFLYFFAVPAIRGVKQTYRRKSFEAKVRAGTKKLIHECRVCGLTSEMDPKMSFRYCSKCEGRCCYCSEHIRNHECVGAVAAADEPTG